ncbi:MDR family MFS transporter [Amycolatopsis panacis]|uniref:DHA2 family efflux MFS transporter permease subunit n=1 Tax=Amycolatopsis panacis TaxID=2340917 RepID=A0A419I6D5_9PSEU|nr:MDR family MFS transporter [Amycolatopsis panacis]RJQ86848.1 DHA2 family efflux MFS transporter permease subunit [Amycolatopsis panacis]
MKDNLARPDTVDADENRISPALWGLASILILGGFTSMFTSTIVNVALDTLSQKLSAPLGTVQWTATGYLMALATAVPVSGWASKRYGATRLWLGSVALFTLFSALCALSASVEMLIIFRVLQGIAGGLLVPAGQILLVTAAGPKRIGRMLTAVSVPIYLAPAVGTTLGSVLTQGLGWPWLFWITVPLGALGFFAGLRWLPKAPPKGAPALDVRGLIILVAGLPLLTYGVAGIGENGGRTETIAVIAAVAGALLLALFTLHAVRSANPLLNLRLFKDRAFSSAAVVIFCMGIALFGAMIVLPIYFLQVRHEDLVTAGLLTAPSAIGTVLALPLAGRMTDKIGGARVIFAGLIVTIIGTIPLALVTPHDSYVWLSLVQIVRGIGIGMTTTPAMAAGLAMIAKEDVPHATPIFNVLQRVGGSFGTALMTVLVAVQLASGPQTDEGAADAIGYTHWWIVACTAIVLIPSMLLVQVESRRRQAAAA